MPLGHRHGRGSSAAKGKIAGTDRTIESPAITLNLVKPATVELASKALEIKPGATFELKGTVVRKGTFKEPVTVKVNNLPAGSEGRARECARPTPRSFHPRQDCGR